MTARRPRVLPLAVLGAASLVFAGVAASQPAGVDRSGYAGETRLKAAEPEEHAITVQYLEIVTPEVDATIEALSAAHGVTFGDPIAEFGNARTAELKSGGMLGVRAPMRATEKPVVRPYVLVEDIDAAIEAAKAAGGEVAIPPMEIPGRGTFAIYLLGGIDHGLWQR